MEAIKLAKTLKARRYRNRRLDDFLKELNLSEGRATGIPTIQNELHKNGSSPARIETDKNRSYFLIKIPCKEGCVLKSKLKSELKGELKTLKTILDLIIENPKITTNTLVEKSGKSRSIVQKCIKILKEEACLDREGAKNGGYWIILE